MDRIAYPLTINVLKVFFLSVLFVSISFPQSPDSSLQFFPLAVGNEWQYHWQNWATNPPGHLYFQHDKVVADTVMPNGKQYFVILRSNSAGYRYLRVDTAAATVNGWMNSSGDIVQYDLKTTLRNDTVFGIPTRMVEAGFADNKIGIAYGFGEIWRQSYSFGLPHRSTLTYCRINGKEYGTLLSIPEQPLLPEQAQLFQNYPNPFNPATTIAFRLPHAAQVTLTVYDVLGRKVALLLAEERPAGEHSVRFEAGEMASGMYIYTLSAGEYKESKKLTLVR
jgi:hypothetical protein